MGSFGFLKSKANFPTEVEDATKKISLLAFPGGLESIPLDLSTVAQTIDRKEGLWLQMAD